MATLAENVTYMINSISATADKIRTLSDSEQNILLENFADEIQELYDNKGVEIQRIV